MHTVRLKSTKMPKTGFEPATEVDNYVCIMDERTLWNIVFSPSVNKLLRCSHGDLHIKVFRSIHEFKCDKLQKKMGCTKTEGARSANPSLAIRKAVLQCKRYVENRKWVFSCKILVLIY